MAILPTSIRPLGTSTVSRASLPTQLGQKAPDNKNNFRRVREVKSAEQLDKRKRKIQRVFITRQKQGNLSHFARQMNAYVLRVIYDWESFSDKLKDPSHLDDATRLFLNVAHSQSFLFPRKVLETIQEYLEKYGSDSSLLIEVDSSLIQTLISKENLISNLMTLLAICRAYEKDKIKLKMSNKNSRNESKRYKK